MIRSLLSLFPRQPPQERPEQAESASSPPSPESSMNQKEGGEEQFWDAIPDGALHIVKHIAAVHLLEKLIGSRPPEEDAVLAEETEPTSFQDVPSSTLTGTASRAKSSVTTTTEATATNTSTSGGACRSASTKVTKKQGGRSASGLRQRSVDLDAVSQVVRQCPSICQERFLFVGKDGKHRYIHPLSLICTLKPPVEIVESIYDAYPLAASTPEPFRGSLPLHYAAAYEAPLPVLQFLVSKHPAALQARLTENISPLDLACYHYTNVCTSTPNVDFLLRAHPEAAGKCCTEQNWFPLHSAISSGAPLNSVIRPLVHAYPEALSALGKGIVSPLHLAARRKKYSKVTEFLVANSPAELLTTEDQVGHTPLTLAAMNQNARVISALLNRIPAMDQQRRHHGWTLLHLAAVHNDNASTNAVTYLAKRFPEQLLAATHSYLSTPLHLACRKGAPMDNIKTLARLNRNVLQMTDGFGKTPYDLAMRRARTDKQFMEVALFLREYEANPLVQF